MKWIIENLIWKIANAGWMTTNVETSIVNLKASESYEPKMHLGAVNLP